MENNMTQKGTVTISLQDYLDLKNFYEETIKNKIVFYNGYIVRNNYTNEYDFHKAEFLTTEEAILEIQKYNTKLQEQAVVLCGEAEKLRKELRTIKELPKYEKIDPIIENTKENTSKKIPRRLFKLFKK